MLAQTMTRKTFFFLLAPSVFLRNSLIVEAKGECVFTSRFWCALCFAIFFLLAEYFIFTSRAFKDGSVAYPVINLIHSKAGYRTCKIFKEGAPLMLFRRRARAGRVRKGIARLPSKVSILKRDSSSG